MEYLGLVGLLIIVGTMSRWFWRAWTVNIPKQTPVVFLSLLVVGLVCGGLALMGEGGDPYAPWAVGLALVFLYLMTTGAQRVSDDGIGVGDTLPAFSAPDDQGETFDSASLAGSRVLIKFFRGHW